MAVAGIAGEPRHRQREDRAQPLAAGRDQVIGDLRDHRHLRSGARQYGRIDAPHVGGHEVEQTVDGGGRTAFEWDDDGQESGLRRQGRASIETLWWRGKCAKAHICASDGFGKRRIDVQGPIRSRHAREEWRPRAGQRLAVLVPCFNEEAAIAKVVADFRAALPEAAIYVYDNNSDRPHRRGRPRRRRRGAARAASGQGQRGAAHVRRRRCRHLRSGRRRRDLSTRPACARMIARLIEERLDMVVAARVEQERGGLSSGSSNRQPAAHGLLRLGLRRDLHRYSLRLSRVLAPVREVISGPVARIRDRDRAFRSRARARAGGGRGPDALLRAAGRLGVEAQHLARRLAHSVHHRRALPLGAAARFFLRARQSRSRSSPSASRFRSS